MEQVAQERPLELPFPTDSEINVTNDPELQPAAAQENPCTMNGDKNIHFSPPLPDFKWINSEIPILEVAKRLGLAVRRKKVICPECAKRRLTFTTVHNGWKCWNCDPGGKMHSVMDLVMLHRKCPAHEAARWIGKNWKVAGRIQVERSENARGETRHTYYRYRSIPFRLSRNS